MTRVSADYFFKIGLEARKLKVICFWITHTVNFRFKPEINDKTGITPKIVDIPLFRAMVDFLMKNELRRFENLDIGPSKPTGKNFKAGTGLGRKTRKNPARYSALGPTVPMGLYGYKITGFKLTYG